MKNNQLCPSEETINFLFRLLNNYLCLMLGFGCQNVSVGDTPRYTGTVSGKLEARYSKRSLLAYWLLQ